nr:hypothetical protein [Tanacetum cinerariifolium]
VNPLIDHHCCYECGNSLNDFFCYQCTCEFCGNGANVGYNCPAQVPSFQTLPRFPQQYPCCEDCGVTHEPYQCQLKNHDYYHEQNSCYDSNSYGFDHGQPPRYTVNHPIFIVHNDIITSQTMIMEQMTQLTSMCKMFCQFVQKKREEKRIEEEQMAKVQNWKLPVCYDDDDDVERSNSLQYNIISGLPSCSLITPNEPVESLSMGDEHINTILATESDEFIKSCVENLVPNPSESEGENGCDVLACFTTFSNVLFDAEYEFDSSDDQSLSDEDFSEEIFLNPLFEEKINSMRINHHQFNAELLYDNSSPRPPEEFVSENSNANIESFSPSPIPTEDSDSFMEEIDLTFTPDDPMLSSIEEDDDDSERDTLIHEELLDNYSLSLPVNESFYFDIPLFSHPPAKPPDGNTGILNIKIIGDISDQKLLFEVISQGRLRFLGFLSAHFIALREDMQEFSMWDFGERKTRKGQNRNKTLMGYVSTDDKLTFQKGKFSPQWRILIHALLHCFNPKKTSWEQFSSNIATALICLATNRTFNFSKMIFDCMVKNLDSKSKFLMCQRFIQLFLNKHKRLLLPHNKTYIAPTLTQKLFSNMRRDSKGYTGVDIPLFLTMLAQGPILQGEGSIVAVESHYIPTCAPSTSLPPFSSPPRSSIRQKTKVPQPSFPTHTHVTDEAASTYPSMPHDLPLPRVNTLGSDEVSMTLQELMVLCTTLSQKVESLEADLKQTKQVYGAAYTSLIMKVKKLEKTVKTGKARRKAHIDVSDSEEEFEDPSKQGRSMIEEIDQDVEVTLSRRRRAVSTRSGGISTTSRLFSTAKESISTAGASMPVSTTGMIQEVNIATVKDKDKGIMTESEPVQTKTKRQQEQEILGLEAAMRLQEQFDEKERDKYSEVDQAKMLVDLINQRKRYFAAKRDEKRRKKPMTQAQQRTYMSNCIKHIGSYTLKKLKKLSFDEIKELFKAIIRIINDFVPMESEDDKEVPKLAEAKRDAEELEHEGKRVVTRGFTTIDDHNTRKYWKIIIVGNHTKVYQFFDDMLKVFDMDDFVMLWSLVKKDSIQQNLLMIKKENYRIHHVSTNKGMDIYMLVEKEYPLSKGILTQMLCTKLMVEEDSEMCRELIRKIFMQVERPRR